MSNSSRSAVFGVRLGLWNLYFIGVFALAYFGYMHLKLEWNAALLVGVLWPLGKALSRVRHTVLALAAFALAYHESFLPGLATLKTNQGNVGKFSWTFLFDFVRDFINPTMLAAALLLIALYFILRNFVRVGTVTLGYFAFLLVSPYLIPAETEASLPVASCENKTAETASADAAFLPLQDGKKNTAGINAWLKKFFEYEAGRRASIPKMLAEDSTPFDIIFIHICSLAWDDIRAVQLTNHPLFEKFDVQFTNFNSVTTYSGPASLRLLNSACGQLSHEDLYKGTKPECQTMNLLENLGYKQYAMIDDAGTFHNWLDNLRKFTELRPEIDDQTKYAPLYDSFFGVKVYDTRDIFKSYLTHVKEDNPKRSAAFLRFTVTHDGNRKLGTTNTMPYADRARRLFDDVHAFLEDLEASGRRAVVVFTPEHGAAVRGDRIQVARLRDIPSPHITNIPVMMKFVNLGRNQQSVTVDDKVTYLAMTEVLGRALTQDVFAENSKATLKDLTKDLPRSWAVAENADAAVVEFKGQRFVRLAKGEWIPYSE
jgi:cellulose synthase operon protein YhjU